MRRFDWIMGTGPLGKVLQPKGATGPSRGGPFPPTRPSPRPLLPSDLDFKAFRQTPPSPLSSPILLPPSPTTCSLPDTQRRQHRHDDGPHMKGNKGQTWPRTSKLSLHARPRFSVSISIHLYSHPIQNRRGSHCGSPQVAV